MSQPVMFAHSPVKASTIIGTPVVNTKAESLGEIKEIVIDPKTGRVAYVVVAFGGFLTMGKKLFAIPFSAFDYNLTNNDYVLNVPKERLEKAPGFDAAHWPAMSDEMWNRSVYSFYGRTPYWE